MVSGKLRAPEERLVTLIGAPGVGKSRLAAATAHHVRDDFESAWLLDDLRDRLRIGAGVRELAAHLVAKLQLRAGRLDDPIDVLREHLGATRSLLVLDDCDHVVSAVARLGHDLLRACPELRLLVTSARPLQLQAESLVQVRPLELPDAVELFLAHAPRWQGDPHSEAIVGEICSGVDGLPLAVELAAGRTHNMPLEAIQPGLKTLVDLLREPGRRNIETAIGWSYDLLSERQKRLMRAVSVFDGGFDLANAGHVYGEQNARVGGETDGLLATLCRCSMLQPGRSGGYRCLEPIRQFCEKKLETSGERPIVQSRYLEMLGLAPEVGESLPPGSTT